MFTELGLASMMLLSAGPNGEPASTGFVTGECVLTVVNQHSVHPGTKVSVREADGSDMIVLVGVEDEAGLISTEPFVVDNPAGLTVHVSPGPSGVTSLLSEDVSCEPVKPEPVQVPEPSLPAPTAPTPTPEPAPIPETAPEPVTPETTAPTTEPTTPSTTVTPTTEPPVDVMNTPDRPELAMTGVETSHIAAVGALLLAAGSFLFGYVRQVVS